MQILYNPLNFNTFSVTRGNKYKLQKSSCHYNIRKYSIRSRVLVVNMWNSLPNDAVEADRLIGLLLGLITHF